MHVGFFIPIAFAALLSACGSCGSKHDAVALARGLSQERLAQLFSDVQSLQPPAQYAQIYVDGRSGVPNSFKDLDPQSITSDGDMARVHLAGCVDDKVLLIVKGIGESGQGQIVLLPGETRDPAVLWQSE